MHHGEHFMGNPVIRIVVPVKFQEEVLRTSHDQLGHLGVLQLCPQTHLLASDVCGWGQG